MSNSEWLWQQHTTDAYRPIEEFHGQYEALWYYEPERWLECSRCGQRPRLLLFNNSHFAKCWCADKYGNPQARSESICSHIDRWNGSIQYYFGTEELLERWNRYAKGGLPELALGTGLHGERIW